ncbi:MAG: magnesium/cobalt transporter CorA [Chloroflexi bacterium]|nr:magnesium/cobalt transporter CorA [Chloroflexota bacterium]
MAEAEADPTVRCLVRHPDGSVHEQPAERLSDIDSLIATPNTMTWLAMRNPSAANLDLLHNELSVHALALEDVRKRHQRPKFDLYPDQHVLVMYEALRPADANDGDSPAFELGELHLLGGPGWMVSVQWHDSPAIEAGVTRFGRRENGAGPSAGAWLYTVFDAAADSYFPILDDMAERMDALEDQVLTGDGGRESLREILAIKRQLLELRRVLGPMRDTANALLRRDLEVVDAAVEPYFQDLYDHLVRILDQLDLYRDLLASVLDARLTVTSNSLNAIMKRLTAFTVILMVPTLIAGIYGMNFVHMPELEWQLGYPLALGLMVLAIIGALTWFRRRDWL